VDGFLFLAILARNVACTQPPLVSVT